MESVRIVLAQINPLVGDIDGNTARVLAATEEAIARFSPDVVIFPELTLTGYPPEDLLLRPSLQPRIAQAQAQLCAAAGEVAIVVGYPRVEGEQVYNSAGVFMRGECIAEYDKQCLPNYRVFDEKRYFQPGNKSCVFALKGLQIGLTICEDIWEPVPASNAVAQGARLLLNLNASPFHLGKHAEREAILRQRAQEIGVPIVYVNQVGGQDELVFDGTSMAVNAQGAVMLRTPSFQEHLALVTVEFDAHVVNLLAADIAPAPEPLASVYDALVLGVRDYVNKNQFPGVVLGLSGGIDSALTLAIAVDALGAQRVQAVMMPFNYTAAISIEDAQAQAHLLGVMYSCIPIAPVYNALTEVLRDEFAGLSADKTEENLQARVRGVMLMAISNKKGSMVLTTGNKSEMAVGYCTLYGDMAGGFDVLRDVSKTLVFALARHRNTRSAAIPERVITRPPSAELAPDQVDQDTLPQYDMLDAVLDCYIEHDMSAEEIVAQGFAADIVYRVLRMVDINEYKRQQAAPGVRITQRGFGKDRRYPITSGWKPGI